MSIKHLSSMITAIQICTCAAAEPESSYNDMYEKAVFFQPHSMITII